MHSCKGQLVAGRCRGAACLGEIRGDSGLCRPAFAWVRGQAAQAVLGGLVGFCVDGSKAHAASESLKEFFGGLGRIDDVRAVERRFGLRGFCYLNVDWAAGGGFGAVENSSVNGPALRLYDE